MNEIYEFITSRGVLTSNHLSELKEKRGFSDEIIKSHRFFSGGKYLLEIESELISRFDSQKLVSSGVFVLPDGAQKPVLSTQLLDDRIIIPYLDDNNKAYFIRPHKMGLKATIQIYHDRTININDSPLMILAESEFKAVAAIQLGFKAIGVPGVGSFAGDHFKRLMEFIKKSGVKAICIIFDNEVKNDPQFPNYKEKPINRYDTEYFSFLLCKLLFNEGIDARIGRLPDNWRINGKIDIDGALAAGKTSDDLKWVVHNSKPYNIFFEDLPKEAKDIVFKKMQKKYHRSYIHVNFNRYIATRYSGKKEYDEEISNFIIKILATHETAQGMIREAVLIDSSNKASRSFGLTPTMMSDSAAFREICIGMGNYVWKGRLEDLAVIWEEQFFDDDGRIIVEPDHVGVVSRETIFLASNVVINLKTGEEYRPDGDGIFWIGDRGYKPMPIVTTTGKDEVAEGIPYLNMSPISHREILDRFAETIGINEARIALGWMASFAFMEEIFALYGCFPFLFVTGKRGSGKSTVAEWIARLSGTDGSGRMLSDTTTVAIQRLMGYYSCLPVLLDEFRNNKLIAPKVGMMRNVYNRQSAGKGTRESFGIREGKVRGGLIISGEETPEDNALLTRCIVINISTNNRKINNFNWFQANKKKFSNYIYTIIKKRPGLINQYIEDLNEGKRFFIEKGLDDRMAIHYSIVGSGFGAAFGDIPKDFMDYMAVETVKIKDDYEKESAVNVFWEDIQALISSGELKQKEVMNVDDAGMVYFYFHLMYIKWAEHYRRIRGGEPFKSSAIRDYLEEERGFVDSRRSFRINGKSIKCVVFQYENANETIKDIVDGFCGQNSDHRPHSDHTLDHTEVR